MSQFTFMFLLIIVWPIPIVLATVFYLQKRKHQQKLDAIKKITENIEETLNATERRKKMDVFLRKHHDGGSKVKCQ